MNSNIFDGLKVLLKNRIYELKPTFLKTKNTILYSLNFYSAKHGGGIPLPYTKEEMQNIGNELSKILFKKKIKGTITCTALFEEDHKKSLKIKQFGWRNGHQTQIGLPIEIFNPAVYDGQDDDYEVRHDKQNENDNINHSQLILENLRKCKQFHQFILYMFIENKTKKIPGKPIKPIKKPKEGGSMQFNDCLYHCFKGIKIPWTYPLKLKKFLGIEYNAKISIDQMEIIEAEINKKNKICIFVSGNYEYESKFDHLQKLYIQLKNGHYTIDHKKTYKGGFFAYEPKPFLFHDKKLKRFYDGNKIYETDQEDTLELVRTMYIDYHVISMVYQKDKKMKRVLSIEEQYNNYLIMTKNLLEATKKSEYKIDLNLYGTIQNMSYKLLNDTTHNFQPEDITIEESIYIMNSSVGAICFNEPTEDFTECYKYDIVSCYPSILSNQFFHIPVKKGEFKLLTEQIFNDMLESKIIALGIYRCIIKPNADEKINNLFRYNPKNYYTSISLKHALTLNLEITLDINEEYEHNCLIYTTKEKTRLTGSQCFKSYVDFLFDLKEKKINGAKQLLNIVSGSIAQEQKYKFVANEQNEFTVEDVIITDIHPSTTDENETFFRYVKNDQIYKSNLARIKPFMYAQARFNMSEFILPNIDSIVKCNTDSMISTKKLDEININRNLKYGKKLGNMKYEGHAKIMIKSNAKEIFENKDSDNPYIID
jgi:hypothetical protein